MSCIRGLPVMASTTQKLMKRAFRDRIGSAAGFTLLELLVVIVIIGLLVGYVAPRVDGVDDEFHG